MALLIKAYPDLSGALIHAGYDPPVTLYFSEKLWLYLRETIEKLLVPIHGVTSTLKIVDKSSALIPWSIKQVVNRAYQYLVMTHGRGDGFVELTTDDLMAALEAAKKEPDDILQAAGDTGHLAHHFVEDLIAATLKGNESRRLEILAKFPEDERATNCVIAALCFFVEHNVRFIASEQRVYSRSLDCAGTLDGDILLDSCTDLSCGCQKAAPFKDMRVCLDMKTSNYIYPTYFAQAGFYRYAKVEEFPDVKYDATVILRMGKDDAAQFESFFAIGDEAYQRHVNFFKNALALKISVAETEREMWTIRDERRAIVKAAKDKSKAEQKLLDCGHSLGYKGMRRRTCGDGTKACLACQKIYDNYQETK